jgi:hypothetical protein
MSRTRALRAPLRGGGVAAVLEMPIPAGIPAAMRSKPHWVLTNLDARASALATLR